MANKPLRTRRFYLLIGTAITIVIMIVAILGAVLRNPSISAQGKQQQSATGNNVRSDSLKYLPDGAEISNPSKDVIFADLGGNGQLEEIIFYSLPHDHKAGVLVLKPTGKDFKHFWEQVYDDSWGFYDLSGVYDLNKNGRPQIVAYRGIGASCPGILEIYEYRNGQIERITGPWADNGQCQSVEMKDLNGDGHYEIIVKIRNSGVNPDIYRWNGKQYVKTNSKFPQYYSDKLGELIQSIRSPEAVPPEWRARSCKQAVEIYLLQRRYTEALQLCYEVLRMIDDPQLTNPNPVIRGEYSTEQLERIKAIFEIDKIKGKATIHHVLGKIYKAAGDSQQAQEQFREAQELEDEAKDMASKLPPIKPVLRTQ